MDGAVWALGDDLKVGMGGCGREVDEALFGGSAPMDSGATTVLARLTQRGSFCFSRFLQFEMTNFIAVSCHRRDIKARRKHADPLSRVWLAATGDVPMPPGRTLPACGECGLRERTWAGLRLYKRAASY